MGNSLGFDGLIAFILGDLIWGFGIAEIRQAGSTGASTSLPYAILGLGIGIAVFGFFMMIAGWLYGVKYLDSLTWLFSMGLILFALGAVVAALSGVVISKNKSSGNSQTWAIILTVVGSAIGLYGLIMMLASFGFFGDDVVVLNEGVIVSEGNREYLRQRQVGSPYGSPMSETEIVYSDDDII
jgi:hypothetical protein